VYRIRPFGIRQKLEAALSHPGGINSYPVNGSKIIAERDDLFDRNWL
jgi:hypothetical protein